MTSKQCAVTKNATADYERSVMAQKKRFIACDDSQAVYATGLTATVLVGKDPVTNNKVAIKVIHKQKLDNEFSNRCDAQIRADISELARARSEVTIHKSLPAHNNIVPLLDAEETAESIILVTPYTSAGDLWDKIRYGDTVLEGEARNCVLQILVSFQKVHEQSLVHADVKPHNFLLFKVGEKYVVQLCDFGLTETMSSKRSIPFTGLRGTSGYFAPEMIGEQTYGEGIDMFALGVILFMMLGGYEPFFPATNFVPVEFEEKYWGHISTECRDLIEHLLKLDPSERIKVPDALNHPWFKKPASDFPNIDDFAEHDWCGQAPPNPELRFHSAEDVPRNGPYFEGTEFPFKPGGRSPSVSNGDSPTTTS